ncbi:hypothetical protein PTI98_006522 [Pleurotus ostreatus]|nr:hypothetical protein PTI98_006522 [Pleurotus ostreatus]
MRYNYQDSVPHGFLRLLPLLATKMPYPLTKLPTSPDDITAMDPRHALKLGMAFTKNGLLQALNNLYNLAPAVEASRSAFVPFLDYASMTFSILLLHLEGDDLFFSTPNNGQGKTLQAILGANCNPTMSAVVRSIKKAQVLIEQWRKTPEDYTAAALRSAIDFGPHMLELMQAQVRSLYASIGRGLTWVFVDCQHRHQTARRESDCRRG